MICNTIMSYWRGIKLTCSSVWRKSTAVSLRSSPYPWMIWSSWGTVRHLASTYKHNTRVRFDNVKLITISTQAHHVLYKPPSPVDVREQPGRSNLIHIVEQDYAASLLLCSSMTTNDACQHQLSVDYREARCVVERQLHDLYQVHDFEHKHLTPLKCDNKIVKCATRLHTVMPLNWMKHQELLLSNFYNYAS